MRKYAEKYGLFGLLALFLSIFSFYMGQFSLIAGNEEGIALSQTKPSMPEPIEMQIKEEKKVAVKNSSKANKQTGTIYASKKGKKYYYASCKASIKEENKIWFQNEDEAVKRGYSLSKTCKK